MIIQASVAALKYVSDEATATDLATLIRRSLDDKGFDAEIAVALAEQHEFGRLFGPNVLGIEESGLVAGRLDEAARDLLSGRHAGSLTYRGEPSQLPIIDQVISISPLGKRYPSDPSRLQNRAYNKIGATRQYTILGRQAPSGIQGTPVTILGAGISGLMVARSLLRQGWDAADIKMIDKEGAFGGIWEHDHVSGLSRNNPFNLNFLDYLLYRAPGTGKEIRELGHLLAAETPVLRTPTKGNVFRVEPGDLYHIVHYESGRKKKTIEGPIVINTLGLGKPLPVSDPDHMVTYTPFNLSGRRWQEKLTKKRLEAYAGKTLVFIGLGNSTAEMLAQLNASDGCSSRVADTHNIKYYVLTHLPPDSIWAPDRVHMHQGKPVRVFRDLSAPNLDDLAGDLPEIRDAYTRARNEMRIIAGVNRWERDNGGIKVFRSDGRKMTLPCDYLFTLIGYGHDPSELEQLGLTVRSGRNEVYFDYDGEFQQRPGEQAPYRVYRGYFGLGPLLKAPENPNARVIPGNMFRMGDLLFGVNMRAMEYQKRKQVGEK